MQVIVLLPMIVTVLALFRRPPGWVFLWIYLPVMLLLPTYFSYKPAGLPAINFSEAVLLPLGAAVVWRYRARWQFASCDAWMALYVLCGGVFYLQTHATSLAAFAVFHALCVAGMPYVIGRLLIEGSELRVAAARRVVGLSVLCCLPSLLEYVWGKNAFANFWWKFFQDQPLVWRTQMRWGFGRVAGPYGQSELAGMVWLFALVMAVWVGTAYPWKDKFAWPAHPFRKRTVLLLVLLVTLFTTQARGPWLGCLLAVPIALLGRMPHLRRNATVLLVVCAVAGAVVYAKGSSYTRTDTVARTDEQQTAQYRRQLIDVYVPIAKSGGAFGLGEQFPKVGYQDSIDNEYLFVWLVKGWVGLGAFLLVAGDTAVRLLQTIAQSTGKRDRFFALSLLGVLCGMLLTVGTVFLAQQPYQIFFLVVGWAQSLPRRQRARETHTLAFAHAIG